MSYNKAYYLTRNDIRSIHINALNKLLLFDVKKKNKLSNFSDVIKLLFETKHKMETDPFFVAATKKSSSFYFKQDLFRQFYELRKVGSYYSKTYTQCLSELLNDYSQYNKLKTILKQDNDQVVKKTIEIIQREVR